MKAAPSVSRGGGRCASCRGALQNSHRYCNSCHAAYMREWRRTHPLTGDARRKMLARAYANAYQRRGKLQPAPCEVRGCSAAAQKHHDDYSKPLAVRWICREHHLALHGIGKRSLQVAA